jgi:hypothetical protein
MITKEERIYRRQERICNDTMFRQLGYMIERAERQGVTPQVLLGYLLSYLGSYAHEALRNDELALHAAIDHATKVANVRTSWNTTMKQLFSGPNNRPRLRVIASSGLRRTKWPR